MPTSPAYALSGLTRLFGSRRPPSQSARAWSAWRAAPASPSAPARVSRVGPLAGVLIGRFLGQAQSSEAQELVHFRPLDLALVDRDVLVALRG